MNIICCGPEPSGRGGVSTVASQQIEWYRNSQHEFCYFATTSLKGGVKGRIDELESLARIASRIASGNHDVAYLHLASRGSYLRKATVARVAAKCGIPYVLHLHGGEFDSFVKSLSARSRAHVVRTFREAEHVIVLSESWAHYIDHLAPGVPIATIPNGVKPTPPHFPGRAENPLFLFLGRIGQSKGAFNAIEGFLRTPADCGHLAVIGDGDIDRAQSLVARMDPAGRVKVRGWLEGVEKQDLLSRATGIILPSKAEGLPMSILEAMAHGVVPITTAVGGLRELISDGKNGMLLRRGEPDEIAAKVQELVGVPGLAQSLGTAAFGTIRSEYALEHIQTRILAILKMSAHQLHGGSD